MADRAALRALAEEAVVVDRGCVFFAGRRVTEMRVDTVARLHCDEWRTIVLHLLEKAYAMGASEAYESAARMAAEHRTGSGRLERDGFECTCGMESSGCADEIADAIRNRLTQRKIKTRRRAAAARGKERE